MSLGPPPRPGSSLMGGLANCEVYVDLFASAGGASIGGGYEEGCALWPAAIRPMSAEQLAKIGADLTEELYECFIPHESGAADKSRIRLEDGTEYRVRGGAVHEGGESGVVRLTLEVLS